MIINIAEFIKTRNHRSYFLGSKPCSFFRFIADLFASLPPYLGHLKLSSSSAWIWLLHLNSLGYILCRLVFQHRKPQINYLESISKEHLKWLSYPRFLNVSDHTVSSASVILRKDKDLVALGQLGHDFGHQLGLLLGELGPIVRLGDLGEVGEDGTGSGGL